MANIGQKERLTQDRVIQLFIKELGYNYLGNLTDNNDNSNINVELLRKYLLGQGYSIGLIESAIQNLLKTAGDQQLDLYNLNKTTYTLLRYGIKAREHAGQLDTTVKFIDWANPLNNDFYIAEEVSYIGRQTKRPDLVLYVNGIALAVIELKRSTVSMSEGIRQNLTNQRKDFIMPFFATVGLVIAGNDSEGLKYGVIETPEKHFMSWREDEEATNEISLSVRERNAKYPIKLDKNLISLCCKERFLDILYNFIAFAEGRKKTCRHNQYFGVKAAQQFTQRREGGIIWHTQGSGKSLIMVWLSKWIKENKPNSRVLIITDREELDEQIEQVYKGVSENIVRTISGQDLVNKLNDTLPPLMCSLIHKFGGRDGEKTEKAYENFVEEIKHSLPVNFSAKGDFFVFVDECHRTQSGKLRKAMQIILPQATFIGFTGTPLFKKDKQTSQQVFGQFIHKYKFDAAVRDKVILDLRYEARDIEQKVESQEKIDAWFEAKTRGLNAVAKAKLKQRWGNMQKIFSSRERLERIVEDIIFDMEMRPRLKDGGHGNALLVAGSIYQACKYYELFQGQGFRKCAIITSYTPNAGDIRTETIGDDGETETLQQYEIYQKMLWGQDIETFEKEVKRKFIEEPEQMKLLIVVDKLLTGFDAPPATYLYIDKSMRDHGLFQAICRVNRLDGQDKDYGYIIDYKDLFRSLENAVADYTSEAFDNYDREDISGLLSNRLDKAKETLEESLEALRALCEPVAQPQEDVDYIHYFVSGNTEAPDLAELEENTSRRERLYMLSATVLRAFSDVSGELSEKYSYTTGQIKKLEQEVSEFIKIRDVVRTASGDYIDFKSYDPDMRHLIDTYLSANPSRLLTKFGDTPLVQLLIERGVQAIDDIETTTKSEQKALAEIIENNVKKEIIEKHQSNPKYYAEMSALLRELIAQRKKEVINYQVYLQQIVDLSKKVMRPEANIGRYPDSIKNSSAQRAFFDNFDGNTDLAIAVHQAVLEHKLTGFRGNMVKENKIKRAIKAVVANDTKAEELFRIVLEQAEY
jgi:type I restriction enzyme R subunit